MKLRNIWLIAFAAGLAGCSSPDKPKPDFFTAEKDSAQMKAFADEEATSAAIADSSLYPAYFTGSHLNSLGMQKLNLILKDSDRPEMTQIYLADGADSAEHRDAVWHYLLAGGAKESQFALVAGTNPNSHTLARKNQDDLDKLNSASSQSSSSSSVSSVDNAMGASAVGPSK